MGRYSWSIRRPAGLAAVAAAALGTMVARADVVNIPPVSDNTLIQTTDGGLSAGGSQFFFAGRTNQGTGNDKRRGVLKFDLAAAIPPGSTVNSASLTLRMSKSNQAGSTLVRLYRLLAPWGEGTSGNTGGQGGDGGASTPNDATWIHRFWPEAPWTTPGGDYSGVLSASAIVGGINFYTFSSTTLAADVQGWVNDSATNFGWIVIGDENSAPTAKRFDSRTNSTVANRPRLTVNFTPSIVVGACCFPDGACQLVTPATCTSLSGSYSGNGTICTPNPCPQPPGACCLPNGVCTVVTEASCLGSSGTWQGSGAPCIPHPCPLYLEPFVDALPIPPVMQPTTGVAGGEASYDVPMREFTQQLHRDLPPTRVWGYAGVFPGPTIEATSGAPVTVRWINDLRDEQGNLRTAHYLPVDECLHGPNMFGPTARTVVHLHGGHIPPEVDGYSEATILPGEETTYVYPNNQDAGTLWYHDHALGITRLNVYMGLAGMYIIRDSFEQNLNLPNGEYEIPLVLQDRSFDFDGSLIYPAAWQDHYHGQFVLVNGKVAPYLNVKRGKYRLRILNGSNSRTYQMTLSNLETFQQIGTDLGLLLTPVPVSVLTLTPGERADVVVNFANSPAGSQVFINNSAPAPYPGEGGVGVVPQVIKFIVDAQSGHTAALPATLRPVPPLNQSLAAHTRDFMLQMMPGDCTTTMMMINGLHWDDITEFPRLGTQEIWRFINMVDTVHPMHVHLVKFQVLDRQAFNIVDGQVVPTGPVFLRDGNEAGWKDTVRSMPGQITRVIARFDDYEGLFAYHCHMLEHEDHEMMRQFDAQPECAADVAPAGNYNGVVNVDDLLAVINSWGNNCQNGCRADVTGNGAVNIDDLLAVINAWGPCE
jgi:spore coat protein A